VGAIVWQIMHKHVTVGSSIADRVHSPVAVVESRVLSRIDWEKHVALARSEPEDG